MTHARVVRGSCRERVATVGLRVLVAVVSLAISACRPPPPDMNEPLSQRYASRNGLIVAHYPATFAAQSRSDSTLQLSHNLENRASEVVNLVSLERPISDDLGEFARVAFGGMITEMNQYHEISRRPATCAGTPGIELIATDVSRSSHVTYRWRVCALIRGGHGYVFSTTLDASLGTVRDAYLRRIVDATQFVR
jgi:hypothetical protein